MDQSDQSIASKHPIRPKSSNIKELHVRTVKHGGDVTMECNISSVTEKDKLVWYRQSSGKLPQYFAKPYQDTKLGYRFTPGFNDSRFSISVNDHKFDLKINKIREDDVGEYFCGKSEGSVVKFTSGIRLQFEDSSSSIHQIPTNQAAAAHDVLNYAAVGCELEEKERFWSELDEVMESILTGERVVIGADFNEHSGEGNRGDEEVMGKFGVKERNLEGQMIVDFAKRTDMAVVNTYFQKREEHRVTYKSGGRGTQVDYILCRRGNLKEIINCKVVMGESVARQHSMVVCRMTLMVCKKKKSKIEIEKKIKCWKLKKEECCEEFRQKLRQALVGQVVLPDDWETTAEMIRETGRKVLGVSSGRRKEDKETWWWNEEVQDSIQRKRLAKKKWDMDRTEENRQEYKELQRRVKREVSKAKQKAYDELYTRLDTREGEKYLYRLARQRD
ncbi:hypothetical protein QTP86_012133 [Hemibagrus guttatus]|nr:hypothetical protein QTP86_012133 [Hemibagrus guttatus]